jgi:large subunit ribosomal protein L28e
MADVLCGRIYKSVVGTTAKSGYRPDLRATAVSRVGALRSIARPKKDVPESKQRGAKARKAAADP